MGIVEGDFGVNREVGSSVSCEDNIVQMYEVELVKIRWHVLGLSEVRREVRTR